MLGTSSGRRKAAGAVIACAVMLLAGCGSGGSSADAGAPVIRGDAPVAADGAAVPLPSFTVTFEGLGSDIWHTMAPQVSSLPTALTSNVWTRDDATFGGWATSETGDVAYADGALYPFTKNATLYPRWVSRPSSTVTFDANGGSGTMANQSSNIFTLLTTNAFTRPSYQFIGWAEEPNGPSVYDLMYTNPNVGPGLFAGYKFDQSRTVYAVWQRNSYTVTFNANGGTGTMANQTANAATALTANAFTRLGYVFDGWATASTGSNAYANGASYPFGENVTLYARWAAVTVPGAPGLTSLSRRSKTEVWVTFSAPSSTGNAPITGYTVTTTLNGVDVTQSFPAEAGRVAVGSLRQYVVYTFTVKAVNSVGTSGPSDAKTFRLQG